MKFITIRRASLFLLVLLLTSIMISACGGVPVVTTTGATIPTETMVEKTADQTFTKEELAKYNGSDGQPAYVAVDGVVYDVTNIGEWKNGMHNGMTAGKDLTNEISKSPHGKAIFTKRNVTVVGKYQ